jgi:hypothetical protein
MLQSRQEDKLLANVRKNPDTGCWDWTGQISNSGYGRTMVTNAGSNHMESAHRASYETFVGPVPEGALVRQRCNNRLCINPDHLEIFQPPGKEAFS